MVKKRGFTLVELMATVAIFSLASIMIFSVFIQGYKIINKTENHTNIQNEARNAILLIQSKAIGNDIFIYNDSDNSNNIYIDGCNGKKVLQISDDDNEILYVEMKMKNKRNQLWQLIASNNEELQQGKYEEKIVLINNLIPEDEYAINVSETNDIVTMNIFNIENGKSINNDGYFATISKKNNIEIDLSNGNDNDGEDNTEISKPVDEFISSLKYDLNIANNLGASTGNCEIIGLGSIGYEQKLNGNQLKIDETIKETSNADLKKIKLYLDNNKGNLNIKGNVVKEESKYVKESILGYEIYLVEGDVNITTTDELISGYNAVLSNMIIISTGDINIINNSHNSTSDRKIVIENSLIYGKNLNIGKKNILNLSPSNILDKTEVKNKLGEMLSKYTVENDNINNIPNGIDIKFELTNDWGEGAQWNIKITNNSLTDIANFKMYFDFSKKITQSYHATITKLANEEDRYELISTQWEEEIKVGQTRTLMCQSEGGIMTDEKLTNIEFYYNYK